VHEDGDELVRVKLGRFSDADEMLVRRVMGKRFRLKGRYFPDRKLNKAGVASVRDFHIQAWANRANCIAQGLAYSSRRQVVVKAAQNHKSVRGVSGLLSYVARLRKQDRHDDAYGAIPIWDGFGRELCPHDVMNIFQAWDLTEDNENLSKQARALLDAGDQNALSILSDRKRLHHIQAWHFIFSIQEDSGEERVEEPFRQAVKATVDSAFTSAGHRVVWGLHLDHTDHQHAHVVVRSLSDFGGRLHSDIHGNYLHALRVEFARNLQLAGLDYEASRRVDRRPLRDKILTGQEELSPQQNARQEFGHGGDLFTRVPLWARYFGRAAEDRREYMVTLRKDVQEKVSWYEPCQRTAEAVRIIRKALAPKPKKTGFFIWNVFHHTRRETEATDIPEQYRELYDVIHPAFHNPIEAISAWQWMATEAAHYAEDGKVQYPNRALANWVLLHRPELLGNIHVEAFELVDHKQLKNMLKKVWLPKPKRIAEIGGVDVGLFQLRAVKRAHRDRNAVIANLKWLHEQGRIVFGDESWRVDVLRSAVDRAGRKQVDEKAVLTDRAVKPVECGAAHPMGSRESASVVEARESGKSIGAANESRPLADEEPVSNIGRQCGRSKGRTR